MAGMSFDGLFKAIQQVQDDCQKIVERNERITKRLNNLAPEIADQVAKDLRPKMENLTHEAIQTYYTHPKGSIYDRTGNFENNTRTSITSEGANIFAVINEGGMNDYPSFFGGASLPASDAFDKFFKEGKHGEGRWLLEPNTEPSPEEYIQQKVDNGYLDADIDKAIDTRIDAILNDD